MVCSYPRLYLLIDILVLGGLGDDNGLGKVGQRLECFERPDHMGQRSGKSLQTDDLGMILVSNDNDGIAFAGMALDDRLDLDHPGAGRVDDTEPGPLKLLFGLGRYPMRTHQHSTGSHFGDLLQDGHPAFGEELQHLGVVNQGAVSADGRRLPGRSVQGQIDGSANPHAETGCFRDDDFHRIETKPPAGSRLQ